MRSKGEREAAARERLYARFGIIDKTADFSERQAAYLGRMLDTERRRLAEIYGNDNAASLAMALVDVNQLAAKIRYHTVDSPGD